MNLDRLRYSGAFPVAVTLFCGLLFAYGLAAGIFRYEQGLAQAEFERRAREQAIILNNGLEDSIEALRNVNRLFLTADEITREQFHLFSQGIAERYPYIKAISFQRVLTLAQRPAFETMRRRDFPAFSIIDFDNGKRRPAPPKPRYRIVDYIEPLDGNETAIGMDVDSYTTNQDHAAARAVDLNQPSASGTYRLIQDESSSLGMGVLMATYRKGASIDTVEERRAALTGYTAFVFVIGNAIRDILESGNAVGHAPSFGIRVYENNSAGTLLYASRSDNASCSGVWRLQTCLDSYQADIDFAGMPWHIAVSAPAYPFFSMHSGSALALLFGVLATSLGAAYLHTQSARTRRIQALVDERTAELMRANTMLAEDIASRKEAEAALQQSQESLRKLAANQEKMIENERKRIAREIHDELGQNLLALRIDAALLHQRTKPDSRFRKRAAAALKQIDSTIKAVRQIINDLRPSVLDLGLPAAIEWQITEFKRRSGILCNLAMDCDELNLDDQVSTALFRILQESLSNIIRHAQACRVWVALYRQDENLILRIKDDGIGMDHLKEPKSESFGLVGIRERIAALGGWMSIESTPGDGVSIIVSIPYPQAKAIA